MIEQDTVRLLRECDAGIQMGIAALGDVLPHVQSHPLADALRACLKQHTALQREAQAALARFGDEGKRAHPIAKAMSAFKTGLEMAVSSSDSTIAGLMMDGCAMGIKSLSKYLNQYQAADEAAKDLCQRLIAQEDTLAKAMRAYL